MTSIGALRLGVSALFGQRAEARSFVSADQIASGSRVTKSSIDPAGLAVSLDLSNRARLRDSASLNINYGVSISQIVNGVLSTVSDVATRLQELAAQSSNGVLSDTERGVLNQEYQALRQELDRINETTEFNGQKIFGNSFGIQSGIAGDQESLSYLSLQAVNSEALGISGDISTQESAQTELEVLSKTRNVIVQQQSNSGVFLSELESALQVNSSLRLGEDVAASRIADADIADSVANNIADNISSQISVALQAHSAANYQQVSLLV